jgi:VanZ family protein
MPPDTSRWSHKASLLNKIVLSLTTATSWLAMSCYLLLAPATSFSGNGLFARWLSALGLSQLTQQLPIDKLIHLVIFFGLVFLWQQVINAASFSLTQKRRLIILNVAGWCCVGIAIEFLQEALQAGRQFDYLDMLANSIGCGLGGWVAKKLTPVETGVATKTNCL